MKQITLGEFARFFHPDEKEVKSPLEALLKNWRLAEKDKIIQSLIEQGETTRSLDVIETIGHKIIWRLGELKHPKK